MLIGVPGSHMFGTPVLYASVLLAFSVTTLVLGAKLHRRLRPTSD
jgi:hypothetical protein